MDKEFGCTIKSGSLQFTDGNGNSQYDNHFSDCLYRSWKDMTGIIDGNVTNDSSVTLNSIISCVIRALRLKIAISDDFLVLASIYANCSKFYHLKIAKEFSKTLDETIEECLSSKNIEDKQRNYLWYKMYLLHSNVWFVKQSGGTSSYKQSVNGNNTILYNNALKIVNKQLMTQKQFIWQNMNKQQTNEKDKFEKLCIFGLQTEAKEKEKEQEKVVLRQDCIEKGIIPKTNELETLLLSIKMGNSNKDFDLSFENNTKIYLTQCLTFSHANNKRFQSAMKQYFNEDIEIKCKYQSAPVKLYDRCVIKATTDYRAYAFPCVANILDFMRFSVTFDNLTDLLDGLNKFTNAINNGKISCLIPNGILRIKNGFSNVVSWKSPSDAQYCDIKLNIIYCNQDNTQCMIVEAQFLFKFLLQAKKMGHKCKKLQQHVLFYLVLYF